MIYCMRKGNSLSMLSIDIMSPTWYQQDCTPNHQTHEILIILHEILQDQSI